MNATDFRGEIVHECTACDAPVTYNPNYSVGRMPGWEHVTAPATQHSAQAKHRCATCKGEPTYTQEAWGDVVECHACGTRTFTSIGD